MFWHVLESVTRSYKSVTLIDILYVSAYNLCIKIIILYILKYTKGCNFNLKYKIFNEKVIKKYDNFYENIILYTVIWFVLICIKWYPL